MFSKLSQLLETIKETLEKADRAQQASQPIKRVTYRPPSNLQRKDQLVNRENTATGQSASKDIIRPRGDGRITGVPVNEHSIPKTNPSAIRARQNIVVNESKDEKKKLTSPKQHRKPKEVGSGDKQPPTSKTQHVTTLDPAMPKITPEQSQPKNIAKGEGAATPPEGNSQGQRLPPPTPASYKNIDPSGKKYGSNFLEEDQKAFFKKPR